VRWCSTTSRAWPTPRAATAPTSRSSSASALTSTTSRWPSTPSTPTACRLGITIKDYVTELTADGAALGRTVLTDRSRTSGKVSLGIDGRGDGKAAGGFAVAFGNIRVVTPS
jgi:hypothetical protein